VSTWTGWRQDLLDAAQAPYNSQTSKFIGDWHSHDGPSCKNNPVSISRAASGSTRCKQLPGLTIYARAYTTQAQGATAFGRQVRSGNYPHLLGALQDGAPYDLTPEQAGLVGEDLVSWGSSTWGHIYFGEIQSGQGVGVGAPKAHKGWAAIGRSVNKTMPDAIDSSRRTTSAALRTLAKARKVRL
jgi:hypothetical protein